MVRDQDAAAAEEARNDFLEAAYDFSNAITGFSLVDLQIFQTAVVWLADQTDDSQEKAEADRLWNLLNDLEFEEEITDAEWEETKALILSLVSRIAPDGYVPDGEFVPPPAEPAEPEPIRVRRDLVALADKLALLPDIVADDRQRVRGLMSYLVQSGDAGPLEAPAQRLWDLLGQWEIRKGLPAEQKQEVRALLAFLAQQFRPTLPARDASL